MDFQTRGYSLQEGEERLLVSGIYEQVLQNSRVQLVERALLDRLMEELKLGSSQLIDRSTALSLGKIMAARLILSGQVHYADPESQVTMRLIETETGRITAAVNQAFGSAVPVSDLTETLSKDLLEKLRKMYPLRGKISEVKGDEISLNIGQKEGIEIGKRFKVVDEDLVLEVTSVFSDHCMAKVFSGEGQPQTDMRVEIMQP